MIKVIFFILLLIQTTNQAHPVTWKSGSVSSFRSTNSIKELKIHYSVSSRYAFGFHGVTLFHDAKNKFTNESFCESFEININIFKYNLFL